MSSKRVNIPPIEKCTNAMAKQLGIDNIQSYLTNDSSLCTTIESTSYPHCILEHGVGFRRNGDKCSTVKQCPPDFEPTEKGCIKSDAVNATFSKGELCDERWTDWFTIPNYHLGNKYQLSNKKCMKPCGKGQVPGYGTDPVDGEKADVASLDNLDKCVEKKKYFSGKYENGLDYCPIAMVKLLSSTPDTLKNDYVNILSTNNNISIRDALINDFKSEAESIWKLSKSILDKEVPINLSQADLRACRILYDDKRVNEAYTVCKKLSTIDGEKELLAQFKNEGLSKEQANVRLLAMKKACHSIFCNNNDNPSAYIISDTPMEPVCFKDVEKIILEKEIAKQKKIDGEESKPLTFDAGMKILIIMLIIAGIIVALPLLSFGIKNLLLLIGKIRKPSSKVV